MPDSEDPITSTTGDFPTATGFYAPWSPDRATGYQIPTAGGAVVNVQLPVDGRSSWECSGCGSTEHCGGCDDSAALDTLARAGIHAGTCGRTPVATTDALERELVALRQEIQRVDPKAGNYQQQAGVLLGAGLAVLAGAGTALPPVAAATGAATAAVVLTAVVLLGLASRPDLSGRFGFVTYAHAISAEIVLAQVVASCDARLAPLQKARELRWYAQTLRRKYRAVGLAVPLLLAGYLGAATTTALALAGI